MANHSQQTRTNERSDFGQMLEAPQRLLVGRISCFFWSGAATLQIGYQHFYGGHGILPWLLFALCVSMTIVCAVVRWDRVPQEWLIATFYVGAIGNASSAADFGLPQILSIEFAISVVFTTFFWRRRSFVVAHLIGMYGLFVGVSLWIDGRHEFSTVLICTPFMVASAVFMGFSSNRFSDVSLYKDRFQATVTALVSALKARDGYTADHSRETLEMVMGVADELGIGSEERQELADVALLHDIGKIGIPNHILHKDGPLTDEEWEMMRQHPVIGEQILSAASGFETVSKAVRHEHERWDGGGYPDGISGEDIPLASRIVLACDAYHAMTSDRPYRKAMSSDDARNELIAHAGSQFDPEVADALVRMTRRAESQPALFTPSTAAQQLVATVTGPEAAAQLPNVTVNGVPTAKQPSLLREDRTRQADSRDDDERAGEVIGRIGVLQWVLSAAVAFFYILLFQHFDVVGGALIALCLVSAFACGTLTRHSNPIYWVNVGMIAVAIVIATACFYYNDPTIAMFLLMPATYTAVVARDRFTYTVLGVIVVLIFVAVPLLVGGKHELLWVPNTSLAFIATIAAQGYVSRRIPEMQFERKRFASTATSLLVALGARDGYTAEHSKGTVTLALDVADELELNEDERAQLEDVALLHDVGKIGIPNEILLKPGRLNEEEWAVMREHPVIGEQIVGQVPGYEQVAKAIRHEHERWDGGGYPDGLVGSEIPLASRIVLACDAYDAMTTNRPYRAAMSKQDACEELRVSAGTQLDPQVVDALLKALEKARPIPISQGRPAKQDRVSGALATG